MFCENCKVVLAEKERMCPYCGNKKLREVREDDFCFFCEKEVMWGSMLAELLKQEHIRFYYKEVLGAGLAMKVGPYHERLHFFVRFSQLEQARSIYHFLFSAEE